MSRFTDQPESIKTVNYEGETHYKTSPEFELYSLVCTSLFNDKFYTSNTSELKRLRGLVSNVKIGNHFISQLAIYAREQMYLRTIPLVLIVEALKAGRRIQASVITRVIQRADEIAEILGYYSLANDREGIKKLGALSNQLKKGVADAFNKFNEYQFGKYNRDTVPSLRDAMFLTHPKPKRGNKKLFERIASDTLETPDTWEVQLSEHGNTAGVWDRLIDEKKLRYMALLRNLRNIMQSESTKLPQALAWLSSRDAVLKSKQLPFRFFSAYKQIKESSPGFHTGMVLTAIEQAAKYAAENIPVDDNEKVLVACDSSASMTSPISAKSSVRLAEVGFVMGLMMQYKNPSSIFGLFADDWVPYTPVQGNILEACMNARSACHYGSTNGHKVLEWLINTGLKADKIYMFSDMQLWNTNGGSYGWHGTYNRETGSFVSLWHAYKQAVPHCKLYLFDLAGYGTVPLDMNQPDVYQISGWSDKVFSVLEHIDKGEDALAVVKAVKL